jgi:FkbM family methyltransferase
MFEKINFYYRVYKRFGSRAILFLIKSKFKPDKLQHIYLKGIKSPVTLSNFGPDVTTLFQVFYANEYDVDLKKPPGFIIDCGANIGLSALFFANKYPGATIVAVEPDKGNFIYLQKNTKFFQNVICINKAVWPHHVWMEIKDMGTGNWSLQTFVTNTPSERAIESITIDEIISEFKKDSIDIIKIDIEGAEKELFKNNYESWLGKTKLIAIELHDGLDKDISGIFYKAIDNLPNRKYYKGENLVCEFL